MKLNWINTWGIFVLVFISSVCCLVSLLLSSSPCVPLSWKHPQTFSGISLSGVLTPFLLLILFWWPELKCHLWGRLLVSWATVGFRNQGNSQLECCKLLSAGRNFPNEKKLPELPLVIPSAVHRGGQRIDQDQTNVSSIWAKKTPTRSLIRCRQGSRIPYRTGGTWMIFNKQ